MIRNVELDDFAASIVVELKGSPVTSLDEDSLADLIEEDGRARLGMGLECSLDRYLGAIPDLRMKSVALDAAIDVSLRSMLRGRTSHDVFESSVRALADSHPELAEQVRLASTLSRQLGASIGSDRSGVDLRARIGREFGPVVQDGGLRYRVVELIGSGSNGAVYRAEDRLLSDRGRPAEVAIKFLFAVSGEGRSAASSSFGASGSIRRPHAKLLEEARRTRRVVHRNVLQVLDFGVSQEDGAFVVAELVRGESLQALCDRLDAPMEPRLAAKLIRDAARGVQAAHEAGVLHCDLKPSNILMDSEGSPRVVDFGAGTLLTSHDANDAAPLGNVAFAAPEQFRGDAGSVSASTDVYALGGMLSYLLTRKYPNGDTYHSVRERHLHDADEPRGIEDVVAGVRDRDLAAVCCKALCPEAGARYQTAHDMAEDLEAWLSKRPVRAMAPSRVHGAKLFVRRNTRLAWLVSAGLIVSAALGTALYLRGVQLERVKADSQSAEEVKARNRKAIETAFQELQRMKDSGTTVTPKDIERATNPILEENAPSGK